MRFDLTEQGYSPAIAALTSHDKMDTALPPVRSVPCRVDQQRCLPEDSTVRVAAAMDLAIHLSRNLRSYLGDRRAYCVERPWVLAEYTIYAAVLLTLTRERQLHREAAHWEKLAAHDLIKPVLLPVSTELEGRRIAGSQGMHLFGSSRGALHVRAQMEILCAEQHTTTAATRHALSHLLLAVPATVTLPPAMCELFARALIALDQRPVRGIRLANHSGKQLHLKVNTKHPCNSHKEEKQSGTNLNSGDSSRYNEGMPDDKRAVRTKPLVDQSFVITDGVELAFSNGCSPFSPSRMKQALNGRQLVRPNVTGTPIKVATEQKSPFSTKKILQLMMGKLPTSNDFD